ncbi:MAG TPA: hypothetical protein VGN15_10460 [Ktedonobacteraceae bacterium]|jgi:hypothetical protein|nr:hypothetical protein [Ktedonobacteraceae bacterium]
MSDTIRYGLPKETIAAIEAEIPSIDIDAVIARMDEIFDKGWGYTFQGPDLIDVPVKGSKGPRNAKPKVEMVPHWQCRCTVSIMVPEDGLEYTRDHPMLLEVSPGAFEVVRDLSLIYALTKGFGLGKMGTCPIPAIDTYVPSPVDTSIAAPITDDPTKAMSELAEIKRKLGIRNNSELDSYIRVFDKDLTSSRISRKNVRGFVEFMKLYIAEHGTAPPT